MKSLAHSPSLHSRQLALNQTLRAIPHGPDLGDLEPGLRQQVLPVLARALARAEQRRHHDVEGRRLPMRAGIGHHVLVDEDLAVAGLHGRRDVGEDLEAHLVGPVVQDGVHEVGAGSCVRGQYYSQNAWFKKA